MSKLRKTQDVALLFGHFLAQAAARHGRELRNAAERFVLGVPGGPVDLSAGAVPGPVADPMAGTLAERVDAFEKAAIVGQLKASQGNVPAAAEALGLPRKTLYDKLQRHGTNAADYR